jgi:hypothetical protein
VQEGELDPAEVAMTREGELDPAEVAMTREGELNPSSSSMPAQGAGDEPGERGDGWGCPFCLPAPLPHVGARDEAEGACHPHVVSSTKSLTWDDEVPYTGLCRCTIILL